MKQLKINPEFEKLCRRLSTDEFDRLEKNIIENGCLDPIQLWNGFIVDGHNRNFICNKHNIEFRTVSLAFDSEDDVMLHIINNQLGRRNLSDLDKAALLARKEPILKIKAKENQLSGLKQNQNTVLVNLPKREKINVRKDMAQELGVSGKTYGELKTINEKGTGEIMETEKLLVDTNRLADLCSISRRTLEKRRYQIAGKIKIGRVWRYNLAVIRERIAQGKSIFVEV